MIAYDPVLVKKRLLQMHFESGVGHIGGNFSSIDFLLVLFHEFLGKNDKFILSKGHSVGALYATLWSLGVLSDQDLTTFHKDDTLLPGHPPVKGINEILFPTGSLGHGLSLAAGTAVSLKISRSSENVFCLTSDGEWQEGSMWEALIFSAHHKLNNLTIIVDHNRLQGFGSTSEVSSMENLKKFFSGFDVDIETVNGHDFADMRRGLNSATGSKPKILILETIKGSGTSFFEGRLESHYLPLNESQYRDALLQIEKS